MKGTSALQKIPFFIYFFNLYLSLDTPEVYLYRANFCTILAMCSSFLISQHFFHNFTRFLHDIHTRPKDLGKMNGLKTITWPLMRRIRTRFLLIYFYSYHIFITLKADSLAQMYPKTTLKLMRKSKYFLLNKIIDPPQFWNGVV